MIQTISQLFWYGSDITKRKPNFSNKLIYTSWFHFFFVDIYLKCKGLSKNLYSTKIWKNFISNFYIYYYHVLKAATNPDNSIAPPVCPVDIAAEEGDGEGVGEELVAV